MLSFLYWYQIQHARVRYNGKYIISTYKICYEKLVIKYKYSYTFIILHFSSKENKNVINYSILSRVLNV